jgi:hypothetical protein
LANDRKPSLDDLQQALDMAGVADPTGAADALGAGLSLYRGDYMGVGISILGMFGFDWFKKLRKLRKAGKLADEAVDAGKAAARNADECVEGPVKQAAKDVPAPKTIKVDLGGKGLGRGAFITTTGDTAVIHVTEIDSADDLAKIFQAARQTGAKKGTLFTGIVTSETDLIRYQRLAASGGSRFGGKVTQLSDDTFRLDFDEFPDFID